MRPSVFSGISGIRRGRATGGARNHRVPWVFIRARGVFYFDFFLFHDTTHRARDSGCCGGVAVDGQVDGDGRVWHWLHAPPAGGQLAVRIRDPEYVPVTRVAKPTTADEHSR